MLNLKDKIFKNPTKKLLESYLFWVNFVQDIRSVDNFKSKLETIKDKTLYKDSFNHFYLTKEEALGKVVEGISVKDVLASNTYPLFLLKRLERISLYDNVDLTSIKKSSQMVWTSKKGIFFHMILDKNTLIYPKSYPKQNKYRYGYELFYNKDGLIGVYDVENDKLSLPLEYLYIYKLGNILELSRDNATFEIYNLQTQETLQSYERKKFPQLDLDIKKQINLEKIELSEYMELMDTPQSEADLQKLGLWNAQVGVMEVPSHYEELLEDSSSGTISFSYPITSDIFDMKVELPVTFKKKDGDFVTIGIRHAHLLLEEDGRKKLSKIQNLFWAQKEKPLQLNSFFDLLKRGNLPDDNRVVPTWMKIKNEQFYDVEYKKNNVDEMINLTSEEFNEFVSTCNTDLLMVFLSTLDETELQKFYKYNEDTVQLKDEATQSSKEQFEKNLKKVKETWTIEDKAKQRATLQIPLSLRHANNICKINQDFKQFINAKYYPYKEDDLAIRYEGTLSKILYTDMMKFIPDYFEQVITHFQDYYEKSNEEHQKIGKHLAKRFGLLINSLEFIRRVEKEKQTSLMWFLQTFEEDIKDTNGYDILKSDELTFHLMNTFASIIHQDDENYISSLISVVERLFDWYPLNYEACEYALSEMMKSVAIKQMSVKNANRFISFFEILPRFYNNLSYETIMSLKSCIHSTLKEHKPLDNKIFENKEVKNKLIVLNYLIDMEDLYYAGLVGESF